MRFRFSILGLLGATAYAALVCAGFISEIWNAIAALIWCLLTFYMGITALGPRTEHSVFARGFICGVLWTCLAFALNVDLAEEWYRAFRDTIDPQRIHRGIRDETLTLQALTTLFGVYGGWLAARRHRRAMQFSGPLGQSN
jgi:hypothetical protein